MYVDNANNKLYILYGKDEKFFRFSYSGGHWILDNEFPVTPTGVSSSPSQNPPSLTRALDGDLFIFFMTASGLFCQVSHDDGLTWSGNINIFSAVNNSGLTDAIAFTYNGQNYIGVLGAENTKNDFFFLRLNDLDDPTNPANWVEETAVRNFNHSSDDHVNMVRDENNNLYAIVKQGTGTPTFVLYHRNTAGNWRAYDVEAPSNSTRRALTVNRTDGKLYIFATAADIIQYVALDKANLHNVTASDWTPIIENGSDVFNNVTTTYQITNATTDILVCAENTTPVPSEVWYNLIDVVPTELQALKINEVNARQNQKFSYVEIFNNSSLTISMAGFFLNYNDNNNPVPKANLALTGTIDPNGYYVVANNKNQFGIEYSPLVANKGDKDVALDGGQDAIALFKSDTLVDQFNVIPGQGTTVSWTAPTLFGRIDYDADGSDIATAYGELPGDNRGTPFAFNSDISLPVFLTTFQAHTEGNRVVLEWETSSEVDNMEWQILRGKVGDPVRAQIARIPGKGTTNITSHYRYVDSNVEAGETYIYQLTSRDFDGTLHVHPDLVKVTVPIAEVRTFVLHQNYPNPFNGRTRIIFEIGKPGPARLVVYDAVGRKVVELVNQVFSPGQYNVQWDGADASGHPVASGIYYLTLDTPEFKRTIKMVYTR
ncbi:MAG: T9SS C-terminal target domain-containing protein [Calditrichaeota bacterium]|nr:MAG: T9SS C-terminal target domain-containing protein [Calditrichota bacterium]